MLKRHKELIGLSFIIGTILILLFWQFFFSHLYPIPGNFMAAWYEPWKTDFIKNGAITIPHKPIAEDIFRQLYPFKTLAADMIKNGNLPLWNPYSGAGMPLFATMHAGLLSPLNFFYFVFSYPLAWSLQVVIQPILIFIFTYLYCKKIHLKKESSIFASVIYSLSGYVVARIIYTELIVSLFALPLLLYLIEDYFRTSSKKVLWLPFIVLLLFVSGHPHYSMYVLLFSSAYFIFRIFSIREKGSRKKMTILIPFLFLLGIGLSAIQILPTLELFLHSNINSYSSSEIIQKFLLPPAYLFSVIIPNYFGNQATYNFWGFFDYIETAGYIGSIPLLFFLYSLGFLKSTSRNLKFFFLFSLGISAFLFIKSPLSELIYSFPIPLFSTSVPSRILFLTTFSITILAGFGFDEWLKGQKNHYSLKQIAPPLLLMGFVFGYTIFLYYTHTSCNNEIITNCRLIALRNTILELCVFGIAALLFIARSRLPKHLAAFLILFLVLGIGVYNANKFLPFSKPEHVMPPNSLISFLQKYNNARVFGIGNANLKTDFASYYRFYDPNYYDPLYVKRYGEFIEYGNTRSSTSLKRSDIEIISDLNLEPGKEKRRSRLLSLLSVQLLLFDNNDIKTQTTNTLLYRDVNWSIFKNTDSLPRAYFVSDVVTITEKEKILEKLFDESFSHKSTAIIENNLPVEVRGSQNQQSVKILKYSENKISLHTATSKPSLLVITDNYYPGWKAYIGNQETNIFRTNYTFRGIVVPKGNHDVSFIYSPYSFALGTRISLISGLIFMATIFLQAKNKRL